MNLAENMTAENLDLVMREDDFVIYYAGEPLTTPGGRDFTHKNARLLKHILLKLTLLSSRINGGLNSAEIFVYLKDKIERSQDFVGENFDAIFENDYVIAARYETLAKTNHPKELVLDYLDENLSVLNLIFWSNSLILEGYRRLMVQMDGASSVLTKEECRELIKEKYEKLNPGQKAGVNILVFHHHIGIVLPLMLVLQIISPSEYANGTLAAQGKGYAGKTMQICQTAALEMQIETPPFDIAAPFDFVGNNHKDALKAMEFMRFFAADHQRISVISELINRGESDELEFKSTFRWDLRQNKKNPAIEHASLKTMAAFMNSDGGDLLIGVEDDGNILGVETDGFPNDDKFLLHLWALIKDTMGQDVSPFIKTTLEKLDGKTVCRVHCLPNMRPVFLRQKGFDEAFYIRIGPSTGSLDISEALKYISGRFKN